MNEKATTPEEQRCFLLKLKDSKVKSMLEGDRVAVYVIENFFPPHELRYVGKACAPRQRWTKHLKDAAEGTDDQPLYHWMRLPGVVPYLKIVEWVEPHRALSVESSLIQEHLKSGHPLLNVGHGGYSSEVWETWKMLLTTNPTITPREVCEQLPL